MKPAKPKRKPSPSKPEATTEFLILPDGRLMVHNLTPTMAALLSELDPEDELMRRRSNTLRPGKK
jgi:hypothetical protein